MLRFFLSHPRVLAFGLLLTLFSSFGQTFLISIFVPRILDSFGLGAGEYGVLYAAATVTSALFLSYLVLVGASQGMAGPMMTAVWAEVYGVQSLGATKGMVATFGVMATALGPLLLGAALAAGVGFPTIIVICLAICGACTVAAFIGREIARRMQCDASVPS